MKTHINNHNTENKSSSQNKPIKIRWQRQQSFT